MRRAAISPLRRSVDGRQAMSKRCLLLGCVVLAAMLLGPNASARVLPDLAPSVTYSLTGTSGDSGWFKSNVTIHWSVSPTQGLVRTTGCEPAVLLNSDSTGVTRECVAEWSDGTTITKRTVPAIKIDKTAPANVAGTAARAPNANGWYRAPVDVNFGGTDATSGIASCTSTTYGGPDGTDRSISGSCRDNAGNAASATHVLDYDATVPAVTGKTASRPADRNGWYNHDLTVTYSGSDATSGIASCDARCIPAPTTRRHRFRASAATGPENELVGCARLQVRRNAPRGQQRSKPRSQRGGLVQSAGHHHVLAERRCLGPDTCEDAKTYSGPDDGTVSVSGTCQDVAGNIGSATRNFKYDATAPGTPPALRGDLQTAMDGSTTRSPSPSPATTPPPALLRAGPVLRRPRRRHSHRDRHLHGNAGNASGAGRSASSSTLLARW